MKVKNDIFFLLDALTPNEKAYVSKYFLRSNKNDSAYLKLFVYLCKANNPDIEDVKREFKNTSISKNPSAAFYYLYEHILDTLTPVGEKSHLHLSSIQQFGHIQFLIRKSLYSQALKKMLLFKQLLEEYEMYSLYIILLQIEIDLFAYFKNTIEEKQLLIQKKIEISQLVLNENLAQLQVSKSENLIFNSGVSTRKVEKDDVRVMKSVLNSLLKEKQLSFKTKHYIHHAFSNIAILEHDYEAAANCLKILLQEYDSQSQFKAHFFNIYTKLICNYINRLVSIQAFEELEALDTTIQEIEKIASVKKVDRVILEDIYITYYHAKYAYYLSLDNFKEAYKMTELMKQYSLPMKRNNALYIIYHYDFACAAIYVQEYDLALQLIDTILNHENKNIFPDVLLFTRILQFIIWYEKDEDILMYSQYDTLRKLIQKANYDTTVEKTYLRMLKKLGDVDDRKSKLALLIEFETIMLSLKQNHSSAFMFFKIFWWIQKEISRLK